MNILQLIGRNQALFDIDIERHEQRGIRVRLDKWVFAWAGDEGRLGRRRQD